MKTILIRYNVEVQAGDQREIITCEIRHQGTERSARKAIKELSGKLAKLGELKVGKIQKGKTTWP